MHRAGEQELHAKALSQQSAWGQGTGWREARLYSFILVLFYKFHVFTENNHGLGNAGPHLENGRGVKIS